MTATAAYTKRLRISTDDITYFDVPADTVTLNKNSSLQENTDLSNTDGFKSRTYGLKDYNVAADGNFKPDTTYQFNIKRGGTPTAFVGDTFSNTSGDIWKIDNTAQEIWDRSATDTFFFFDNAVAIPSVDILSIDYLNGTVTFTGTKTGPITGDGTFIPVNGSDCITTGSIDLSVEVEEDTCIANDTNGWKTRKGKLKDVSVSLTQFNDFNKTYFDIVDQGDVVLLEITLGDTNIQTIRGWFVVESDNDTGGVADFESQDISLQLEGDITSSFSWEYPVSGFNDALKVLTDNYFSVPTSDLYIQVLPEDIIANGYTGPVILESFSLSLDINGKATFSSTLQGNGELESLT